MDQLETSRSPTSKTEIRSWLTARVSECTDQPVGEIDPQRNLLEYGMDSLDAANTIGELEVWIGTRLPEDIFEDFTTIDGLVDYVGEELNIRH